MNWRKKKVKQKGFTLIELIIVIAIIGILAAIAIPNYINFQNSARNSGVKESLGAYRTALAMDYATSGAYPSSIANIASMSATDKTTANANFNPAGDPTFSGGGTTYSITASGWGGLSFTATPTGIAP